MQYELETLIVSIISLVFMFVGGGFALWQWRTGLLYKRIEIVRTLIGNIRQDKSVSTTMDIIDWDEGFLYNGKFVIRRDSMRTDLKDLSDDDLFKMIDHTLSIFTYVCYLRSTGAIKTKDMRFFEYEIRRLADNPHILNYLYSLYHWSQSRSVDMTFTHLIDYCLKKKYIDETFKIYSEENPKYTCYLKVGLVAATAHA